MIHKPYKKLKGVLRANDKTYADLAEVLGISKTSISNKINGKSDFVLSESIKIKSFLQSDDSIFSP